MKSVKRVTSIAAVIGAFSLALAGCDSEDDGGSSQPGAGGGAGSQAGGNGGVGDQGGGGAGAEDAGVDTDAPDSRATPEPGPMMTEQELLRITGTLAADDMQGREDGSEGGALARAFLIDELTRCGVQPAGESGFEQPIQTGSGVNILGKIPGTDSTLQQRFIAISAHYDHLGMRHSEVYNGAYDNAAAVAAVVGVACSLAAAPPRRSVLIAHWDAEEPPTFLEDAMGSAYYAAHPVVPLSQIDVTIVLDLAGSHMWPNYPAHFAAGAETSPQVASALDAVTPPEGMHLYRAGLHLIEETALGHQPWSDYDAFRNLRVPVVFLSNGQNKRYHTTADDTEFIDGPKLANETRVLWDLVQNLDASEETPVFDTEGMDLLTDAETVRAVLEAALASETGMVDSLGLTPASRTLLESDLAAVIAVHEKLTGGASATESDIASLRAAVQRAMCLAGSTYLEAMCQRI